MARGPPPDVAASIYAHACFDIAFCAEVDGRGASSAAAGAAGVGVGAEAAGSTGETRTMAAVRLRVGAGRADAVEAWAAAVGRRVEGLEAFVRLRRFEVCSRMRMRGGGVVGGGGDEEGEEGLLLVEFEGGVGREGFEAVVAGSGEGEEGAVRCGEVKWWEVGKVFPESEWGRVGVEVEEP